MRGIGTAAAIALLLVCGDVAHADAAARARYQVARHPVVRRAAPEPPHYDARPVHYRPYPYRVPAPFVFGYGPFR